MMRKIILFLGVMVAIWSGAVSARAVTVEELQSQLQKLNAQVAQLKNTGFLEACKGITFSRVLKMGSVGSDVKCLQAFLNQEPAMQVVASGSGSRGNESIYFGLRTKRAVVVFQETYATDVLSPAGLARGTGAVGPLTMAKLNALLAAKSSAQIAPVQTPLPDSQPSQTELTVSAIAKASPAVVSLTVTKQVPEYQIVYRDPFGDGVFQIHTYQPTGRTVEQKIGAGTGFIIASDGYIITNKHVVSDDQATYTANLFSGLSTAATIVYKDPSNDVALLKINGTGLPFLSLGNSDNLQLGQPVITIGNALGQFSNSVSVGIVSGLHRTITASDNSGTTEVLSDVIQTDAAINLGNSGGPLLDLQANAVGINVAMVQGGSSNISFALPINPVKNMISLVLGK